MNLQLRTAPLLAAAMLLLVGDIARADPCGSICAEQVVECRRECEGDQECLKECDDSKRLCPDLCRAMMKGGDRAGIERELLKVIEREEKAQAERDAKQEEALDKAHPHDHGPKDVVK